MVKLIFPNECNCKTCDGGSKPVAPPFARGLAMLFGGTKCLCDCHMKKEDRMPEEIPLARTMSLEEKISEMFTYHAPDPNQKIKYQNIREKAKEFARVIYENTPACADQSAAIRLVREAVMTANASIALKGLV
jgi:hypothetical protein